MGAVMDQQSKAVITRKFLIAYGYMGLWIFLSAFVIVLNKYILDPKLGGFPFPLTLTATHMLFCAVVSWLLVKVKLIDAPAMPNDVYIRCVLPIGALFAVVLWTGNAAFLYLSVSFVQMMKALMPLLVYTVGSAFGTEKWCRRTGFILAVVVTGVAIASYGEVVFVLVGAAFQAVSMLSEATRLTLVQVLLQGRGIKLNPITTLYHVAPVCLIFLVLPFAWLEAERLVSQEWQVGPGLLLLSAAAAFALNCSIFLLIGKTSALTLNIAGVAKDVMLIYLSMTLYGSIVTELQVLGYALALCGAFYYNLQKMQAAKAAADAAAAKAAASSDGGAQQSTGKLKGLSGGSSSSNSLQQQQRQQQQELLRGDPERQQLLPQLDDKSLQRQV